MLLCSPLFDMDPDRLAQCLAVAVSALWLSGSGTPTMRWWLGADRSESAWLRYPTLSLFWRYQLLLCIGSVLYGGPDGFLPAEGWWRWETLAYATAYELPLILGLLWLATALTKLRIGRHRRPGTLELRGRVTDAARVLGDEGAPDRQIEFNFESDDGVRWAVESDPQALWATPSLAGGWPLRRVAPTHPSTLPWGGLRAGDRVWLIGGAEISGPRKRLAVRLGSGVVVRGGPAAAYTDLLALTVTFWFFMIFVQGRVWHAAVSLYYDRY
jgi:hypothetical protein